MKLSDKEKKDLFKKMVLYTILQCFFVLVFPIAYVIVGSNFVLNLWLMIPSAFAVLVLCQWIGWKFGRRTTQLSKLYRESEVKQK